MRGKLLKQNTPLGDPSEVFKPVEPSPGDVLNEVLVINEAYYKILLDSMANGLPQPEDDTSIEFPAALTVQELIEQASQFNVDGLPFTVGAPLLVVPVNGPNVGGVILTGQAEGGVNQQGVFEASGTITFGVIGTEHPVTWPDFIPLPDGSIMIGASETISGSIPNTEPTTQTTTGIIISY